MWGKEAPLDLILRHKGLRKMLAMVGRPGNPSRGHPREEWGSGLGQGGGRRNGKGRRYRSEHRCPDFRKQGELGFWLRRLGCTIPWKSRPGRDVAMGRGAEFEVPKGPRWGHGAICVEPGWARDITPKRVGVGSYSQEKGKCTEGGVVAVPSAHGGFRNQNRRHCLCRGAVRQPHPLWGQSQGAPKQGPAVLVGGICSGGGTTGGVREQRRTPGSQPSLIARRKTAGVGWALLLLTGTVSPL